MDCIGMDFFAFCLESPAYERITLSVNYLKLNTQGHSIPCRLV